MPMLSPLHQLFKSNSAKRTSGADGRRPRCPSGQSALDRLGQQLSGAQGLYACVRQAHEEGICMGRGP
jgi:hypothetical protein